MCLFIENGKGTTESENAVLTARLHNSKKQLFLTTPERLFGDRCQAVQWVEVPESNGILYTCFGEQANHRQTLIKDTKDFEMVHGETAITQIFGFSPWRALDIFSIEQVCCLCLVLTCNTKSGD